MGRHGALLAGAAVAAVLSLGLPWASGADATYVPGWYVPGSCVTVYDNDGWASLDCTTGLFSPGIFVSGSPAYGGKRTVARVFIVAVVIAVALALRRRSGALAKLAVALAGAGLVLGGLRPRPGQLVYLAGMALLVLALREDGLRARPRTPAQPPAGISSPIT